MRQLEESSRVLTFAFYQCQFGAKSRKPTRFITTIPGLALATRLGWPSFSSAGFYIGPLPPTCTCTQEHIGIIKRHPDESFRTTSAQAYPPAMDLWMATTILRHFAAHPPPVLKRARSGGEDEGDELRASAFSRASGAISGTSDTASSKGALRTTESSKKVASTSLVPSSTASSGGTSVILEVASSGPSSSAFSGDLGMASSGTSSLAFSGLLGREASFLRSGPVQVSYKGKIRNMVDGLGKNSWGIRPAGARGVLNGKEGNGWLGGKSKRDRLRLLAVLALGKASESPFFIEIKQMRERLDEKVRSLGRDPSRRQGDRETEIHFRRLLAWARLFEENT